MKLFPPNNTQRFVVGRLTGVVSRGARGGAHKAAGASRGFTMMEIAICLAIIGIALVAIIGVLPIGMNVQQDNRQETIIGQDATVLMEDIRNGSLGANELTNYIYAITNYWAFFKPITAGGGTNLGVNGYTFSAAFVSPNYVDSPGTSTPVTGSPITNAANIIGLLSTPEFTDGFGNPINNIINGGYSNHVVAYVYSISGPAFEKPPQDNALMQQGSFGYRLFCVNAPIAENTNDWWPGHMPTTNEIIMNNSVHELRMTFLWPQLANGSLGPSRHTFRTMIAGQLEFQPNNIVYPYWANSNLYVYQSQFFTNTP